MKILHLSNIIGEKNGGGVHEVVSNLYKCQKILKHEPHIWYPGSNKDADSIRLDKNIVGLETYGSNSIGIVKKIFASIDSNKFDILHQHGIWKPISLLSKKFRKKSNIKSVIQPHGYLDPFRLNISKYKKKLAYYFYEHSNLNEADAIVACSIDEGEKLKKIFSHKDIAVIPNGISSEFFNQSKSGIQIKDKKYM